MANLRAPLLLLAAAALALVPAAQAQNQLDPHSDISLAVTSPSAAVPLGSTAAVDIAVSLTLTNYFCSSTTGGTADVTITAVDSPSPVNGISATLTKQTLTFAFAGSANGAGPQTNPTTAGPMHTTLNVTVAAGGPGDHDHGYNVTAAFAGPMTGCQPINPASASMPAAHKSALAAFKTGPAAANTTAPGTGTGLTTGSGTGGTTKASPLADVPTVALMTLAVAFVASRRF